jgi:asparagine synthase (glutamine-hydrolysing)
MCGINGFIVKQSLNTFIHESCIKQMNSVIRHRGPDDSGFYLSDNRSIALGMQRLSIIDLNSGFQPMYSNDNNIVIVFNGEIYNFHEIRDLLILTYSAVFKTNSDTEVILKGYEILGKEIFSLLNGMFALAILDYRINKVVVARDRTGEKPLYYWHNDDLFCFCSELKSLKVFWEKFSLSKPKISREALNLYFLLTYIPAPHTIYDGVFKLEPGSLLEIDILDLSFTKSHYWNVLPLENNSISDYSQAKKLLKDLVYDSVEKRMISDVPYGAFLSGGVDSSIVVAVMADLKPTEKIKTFSIISSNKKFDESERSNSVSKHCKTDHSPILLDLNDVVENIDGVLLNYDEPFADSSALPSYFVSKKTKQKVSVALTGDGGDEVFGGYNRYLMGQYSRNYKKIVPSIFHETIIKPFLGSFKLKNDDRGFLFQAKKFINAVAESEYYNLTNIMCLGFERNILGELFDSAWQTTGYETFFQSHFDQLVNLTPLQKARYLDLKICLDGDMLAKVDRASMLNSLECRTPFLDHRLIEFSYQLPDHFLISNGTTKKILKETFQDMLPQGLFSLHKSGFGIPVGDWLRESLSLELQEFSKKDFIVEQGIFNPDYISKIVFNHLNKIEDNTFKVWTYYCFQKWFVTNN